MKNRIGISLLLPAVAMSVTSCTTKESSNLKNPNILLILADDLGFSDIGCFGSEVSTPNLDSLAEKGIRFTNIHNTSKCFPSRASLLTGLYAQQCNYGTGFNSPLENAVTLGKVLREAGYRTLWAGKHHGLENPVTRGFDRYYGLKDGAANYFNPGEQRPGEPMPAQKRPDRQWCIDSVMYAPYTPEEKDFYATDYFTHYALGWLEEYRNEDKPWFLYMAYTAPHDPLQAWPEDIAKYRGKYRDGYEGIRKARYEKQLATGLIDETYKLSKPEYDSWSEMDDSARDEADLKMAVYAAMIDRLDWNIGRILEKIGEMGEEENTLIIFASDNGASAEVVNIPGTGPIGSMGRWTSLGPDWANVGNTPFRYYKNYSYEGGIRTPMIVYWPKGVENPGRVSHFPGHLMDFMATFLDITGAVYPEEHRGDFVYPPEGQSLLPVFRNEEITRQGPIFWNWSDGSALLSDSMKIVKEGLESDWELYNMHSDPTETNNLANDLPERVKEMNEQYENWKTRVGIEAK